MREIFNMLARGERELIRTAKPVAIFLGGGVPLLILGIAAGNSAFATIGASLLTINLFTAFLQGDAAKRRDNNEPKP